MVFKFVNFLEFTKGYQTVKFKFCELSGSGFIEGLQKHNDDVIMTSFHNFGIQNLKICQTGYMIYQPAKFQIPELFESNFTEVFIRHPKIPL